MSRSLREKLSVRIKYDNRLVVSSLSSSSIIVF